MEVVIIVLATFLLSAIGLSKKAPAYLVGALIVLGYALGLFVPTTLPLAFMPSYVFPVVILSFPYFFMRFLNKRLCFFEAIFFLSIITLSIVANNLKAPLAVYAGCLWLVILAFAPRKHLGLDLVLFPVLMILLEKINFLFLGTSTEVSQYLFYAKGLNGIFTIFTLHSFLLLYVFVLMLRRCQTEDSFLLVLAFLSINSSIMSGLRLPVGTIQSGVLPVLLVYFLITFLRKSRLSIKRPAVVISFLVHPYFLFFFLLDDFDRKWIMYIFKRLKLSYFIEKNSEILASLAFALCLFTLMKVEVSLSDKVIFLVMLKIFLIRNLFSRRIA